MNKTEFKELQDQFATLAYTYDRISKDGFIFDAKYTYYYKDLVKKRFKITEENKMLQQIAIMLKNNKTEEEINLFIDEAKKKFADQMFKFDKKLEIISPIIKHLNEMSNEEIEEVEATYRNYAIMYHPAVKMNPSQNELQLFGLIRKLYFENNLSGLQEILNNSKNFLTPIEINEDDYIKYANYFYDTDKTIKTDIKKKTDNYPYTKFEVFDDAIAIAREEGELRASVNKLSEMNQALHKDFVELFKKDVSFEE